MPARSAQVRLISNPGARQVVQAHSCDAYGKSDLEKEVSRLRVRHCRRYCYGCHCFYAGTKEGQVCRQPWICDWRLGACSPRRLPRFRLVHLPVAGPSLYDVQNDVLPDDAGDQHIFIHVYTVFAHQHGGAVLNSGLYLSQPRSRQRHPHLFVRWSHWSDLHLLHDKVAWSARVYDDHDNAATGVDYIVVLDLRQQDRRTGILGAAIVFTAIGARIYLKESDRQKKKRAAAAVSAEMTNRRGNQRA